MESLFILKAEDSVIETKIESKDMTEIEKEELTKIILDKIKDVIPIDGVICISNFDIIKVSKNKWCIGGSNGFKYFQQLGTSINFKTVLKHIRKNEYDNYNIKCK